MLPFTRDALSSHYEFPQWNIGDFTYGVPKVMTWNERAKLTIGKYCSIGDDVTIFLGGNHRMDWVTTFPLPALWPDERPILDGIPKPRHVVIGNDVWLGARCTIMPGVTVGDGACIGAHAVVAKDVPPYAIVVGNSARVARYRFTPDQIAAFLRIRWWDWPSEKVHAHLSRLCSTGIDDFIAEHDFEAPQRGKKISAFTRLWNSRAR